MIRILLAVLFLSLSILHAQVKTLSVLFTNDVHGGIVETKAEFLNPEYPPTLGGGAAAYHIIKNIRDKAQKEGNYVLVSDAGDIFQGTVLGTKSKGDAIVDYFNYIKLDYCVPGNHDFDLGKDNLIKLIRKSNFPWISCNILDKKTGKLWSYVKPYIIKTFGNVKIGITGITTASTEHMAFSENIKNLDFIPEIPALQKTVNEMREKGVDIVIAVVHTGLPYNLEEGLERLEKVTYEDVKDREGVGALEIARFVKGIDILFGGHIHKGYARPYEDPVNHTLCFQNYGNGGNLGWIDFKIDMKHKMVVGYELPVLNNDLLLLTEDAYRVDPELYEKIKKQQKKYEAGFHQIIGETKTTITRSSAGESLMGDLVCDAMLEASKADFAFTNFGGLRADLKIGIITFKDLFRVLPFGNQLVVFKAKGSFLKKIVEEKVKGYRRGMAIGGAKIVIDPSRPDGDRVVHFEIQGEPLDMEKEYRVVTSDYLMEGNSGLRILLSVPDENKTYPGMTMLDALVQYVENHSPLQIELDGRWKKLQSN
jgi:2',3'-cyclic-nucleotide 2'-phosphodiesterase (5'-nucleotidase family)